VGGGVVHGRRRDVREDRGREQHYERDGRLPDEAPPDNRLVPGVQPRADDEVVNGTPGQRDADDRELDQEEAAVQRLPEIARLGEADEGEVGAGEHHDADEDDRDPREAEERCPPKRRGERPHEEGQRRKAADPDAGCDEVDPVRALRQPRRVRLGALMT
jgi:hypothetical protein